MLYYIYKKQIKIVFVLIISLIIITSWYFFYKEKTLLKWINLELKDNILIFNDSKITKNKIYDYYQVYLTPKEFNIECNSEIVWVCENPQKIKENFKWNILWFYGKDIKKSISNNIEINSELDLNNNFSLIKSLVLDWDLIIEEDSIENDDQKYFSYKKIDENTPIEVNQMELDCLNQIKFSIPEWSFEADNLIRQRVEEECSSFAWLSQADITIWWLSNNDLGKKISLKIDIKSLNINFKFFTKKDKNFELKREENIILNKNIFLETEIKASDIL